MRALIYIPVVHSEMELGTMAEETRARFRKVFGSDDMWTRRRVCVEGMWDGIRKKLLALPLAWPRTLLYQDGLPVCNREKEIVRDLAAQGSRNHRVLVELMERGARLMGTEDPELIVRDYQRIQKLFRHADNGNNPPSVVEELIREGGSILSERDEFIARRIDTTLGQAETGILFLGLLHRVDELLKEKFDIQYLIHSLPFAAYPWRRLEEVRDGR